jgi:hypothetical protein
MKKKAAAPMWSRESTTSKDSIERLYTHSPIFAIAPALGTSRLLCAAGGGSSKTGVSNLLFALRCGAGAPAQRAEADAASASPPRLTVSRALETGYDLAHCALAASPPTGARARLVAALSGGDRCSLYEWAPGEDDGAEGEGSGAGVGADALAALDGAHAQAGGLASREGAELTSVAWAPDGRHLALGDANGRVYVWRLAIATLSEQARPLARPSQPASPAQPHKATPGSSPSPALPPATPRQKAFEASPARAASAAAVSPRDAAEAGSAAASPPLLLACLSGHSARVNALSFEGVAGARLASASGDGTVRVWEVGALLERSRPPPLAAAPMVLCHVLPGRGSRELGDRYVRTRGRPKAGTAAATAGRWQFRGLALVPGGGAVFALESSERGGAVVAKWRCVSREQAEAQGRALGSPVSAALSIAAAEFVRTDGVRLPLPAMSEAAAAAAIAAAAKDADAAASSRWVFSASAMAAQSPASVLAVNDSFDRLAVGASDGSVSLFDCDALGRALWRRANVHQFPVTCAAFVELSLDGPDEDEEEDLSDDETERSGPAPPRRVRECVLVTGSPDAQLALLPLSAPPSQLGPRLVGVLLALLALCLVSAILYVNAFLDRNEL